MKHTQPITIILLLSFLIAQFIGLAIVYQYIDNEQTTATGEVVFEEIPLIERPPIEEKTSFLPIIITILIGTGIFFVLLKYNLLLVIRIWFLIALSLSLYVAFQAFIPTMIALILAIGAALWRIFKPNVWIQNLTELFIYGGLAAVFVPVFNLTSGVILLILISCYDAYAVWKSKHMITLAKSQAKANVFAGLLIPYKINAKTKKNKIHGNKIQAKMQSPKMHHVPAKNIKTAILGGGDIAFPLIFAGIVMKEIGLWQSLIIPFFAAAALALLFWKAEGNKFYPAMPFISAGCFIGLGVVWLFSLL